MYPYTEFLEFFRLPLEKKCLTIYFIFQQAAEEDTVFEIDIMKRRISWTGIPV